MIPQQPTIRQLFDFVKNHLLTQNEKSFSEVRGYCMYRQGSLKCAIGCLISDEQYNGELENKLLFVTSSVDEAVNNSIGRELTYDDRVILRKLQHIHDWNIPAIWATFLDDLEAETF